METLYSKYAFILTHHWNKAKDRLPHESMAINVKDAMERRSMLNAIFRFPTTHQMRASAAIGLSQSPHTYEIYRLLHMILSMTTRAELSPVGSILKDVCF